MQVGLHEVGPSGGPGRGTVRYVRLSEEGEAPSAVELQDALPLEALLAPLGASKDAIVAAVEALQPEPPPPAPAGQPEELHGSRAFGAAIQVPFRGQSCVRACAHQKGGAGRGAGAGRVVCEACRLLVRLQPWSLHVEPR